MKKTLVYLLFAGLCLGSLAGCGDRPVSPSTVPSETVEETPTVAPTDTPTLTPTATPTAAPTDTPVPTEAEDKFEPVVVRVQESNVTVKTGPGEEYEDYSTINVGDLVTLRDEKEVNGVIWYNISRLYDEWIKADDENLKSDAWSEAITSYFYIDSYIGCCLETTLVAYDDSNLIYWWNGGGGYGYLVQSQNDPGNIESKSFFYIGEYNLGYLHLCYRAAGYVPYEIKDTDIEIGKDTSVIDSEIVGEYYSDANKCVIDLDEFADFRFNFDDKGIFTNSLCRIMGNLFSELAEGGHTFMFFKDDNGNLYFWTEWYVDGKWIVKTFYKK